MFPPIDLDDLKLSSVFEQHPPIPIITIGILFVAGALVQVEVDPEPIAFQILEVGFPLLLTLPIFYGAYVVHTAPNPGELQSRMLLTMGSFFLIGSGTVVVVGLSEFGDGTRLHDWSFTLLAGGVAGSSVGVPTGIIYHRMIQSQRELEEEIRRTRSLNERLTVVNRILRHNARNMLSVAHGYLDRAREIGSDDDVGQALEGCESALEGFHKLAEEALLVDRLHSEDPVIEELAVRSLVDDALERAKVGESAADIRTTVPEHLTIRGRHVISIAIAEAIANALAHNDQQGLLVSIDARESGDEVNIDISDSGTGLPPTIRRMVTQGEETPLQHAEGVGMWLIKWICEGSDGRFSLPEPDSGGTTLRLTFSATSA